jgi:hypothetical protein
MLNKREGENSLEFEVVFENGFEVIDIIEIVD